MAKRQVIPFIPRNRNGFNRVRTKKRILISVFDMEIGGVERSLINMLESFDYERHAVDLLITRHSGEFMSLIPHQVRVLPEIGVYTLFRKSILQCMREGRWAAAAIRLSGKLAAIAGVKTGRVKGDIGLIQMQLTSKYANVLLPALHEPYDLAVSYAWPHDIVAEKVAAVWKAAWIHTDYSQLPIDHALDLAVWNKFDYIASISDACTDSFLATYPSLSDRIIPIANIVSPESVVRLAGSEPHPADMAQGTFNLLSVGRLSQVKGFDLAVQALRILHDRGLTTLRWYIVGYGGYEAELTEWIARCGLAGRFVLLGKKSNPYPYMKACDLYVQPSRYEGKAVAVTEAQMLGKPVIIANYPTSASQVSHGVDGWIAEGSPEGLADGIERLMVDHDLRNGLIRQVSAKDYSNRQELNKLYQMMTKPDCVER